MCCICNCPFILEQPGSSLLEWHPFFQLICRRFKIYRVPWPYFQCWWDKDIQHIAYDKPWPCCMYEPLVSEFSIELTTNQYLRSLCGLEPMVGAVPIQQSDHTPSQYIPMVIKSIKIKEMLFSYSSWEGSHTKAIRWFLESACVVRSKADHSLLQLHLDSVPVHASAKEHWVDGRDEQKAPEMQSTHTHMRIPSYLHILNYIQIYSHIHTKNIHYIYIYI